MILLLLLILGSAYISLSQIALFSLPSLELKLYKQQEDPRKELVVKLLSKPYDLLVTLLCCDIGMNILIQNRAASLFGKYNTWTLNVGVPLLLTLLFGEVIPKTIALSYNRVLAPRVVPFLAFLHGILNPLLRLLTQVALFLSNKCFFFLKKEQPLSKEEVEHVLQSAKASDVLSTEEAALVDGFLSLADYTVKERMHPRQEILFYDLHDPLSKLLFLFVERECTRVPVCKGSVQNMVGILSAKCFFLHRQDISQGSALLPFLTPPYYLPETISAKRLLNHFFRTGETMGIVVDEYGSISGLITREDLFEIVVGEISDTREKSRRYTTVDKNAWITSGKFELSEFKALFGVELPNKNNMVTLGGWLTEEMGTIPKSGTHYTWEGFIFHILAADPQRIRRIYIRTMKR